MSKPSKQNHVQIGKQWREDGWIFVYDPSTRFIEARHPMGGLQSIAEVSGAGPYGGAFGHCIAALLNDTKGLRQPLAAAPSGACFHGNPPVPFKGWNIWIERALRTGDFSGVVIKANDPNPNGSGIYLESKDTRHG